MKVLWLILENWLELNDFGKISRKNTVIFLARLNKNAYNYMYAFFV